MLSCILSVAVSGLLASAEAKVGRRSGKQRDLTLDATKESFAAAVEGKDAFVPCNIDPPSGDDAVLLILVTKDDKPIFSIDARSELSLAQAKAWSDLSILGQRAHFDTSISRQGLAIHSTTSADTGYYKCRVDFEKSATRNLGVKLSVIVPPKTISIVGPNGLKVRGLIGPFQIGQTITLSCHVKGGSPPPSLVWFADEQPVDAVIETLGLHHRENVFTVRNLTRDNFGMRLTCSSSNSNLQEPLNATVLIDMIFPPETVRIAPLGKAMQEGQPQAVLCETKGSKPPSNVTWWLNDSQLRGNIQTRNLDDKGSQSILKLTPNWTQDKAILSCRVTNQLIPAAVIEDSIKIDVVYSPRVNLKLGDKLNLSDVKEGEDLYFECQISANPKVDKITWLKDGSEYIPNATLNELAIGHNLVLQQVKQNTSGKYGCRAQNRLGEAESPSVLLEVKYPPSCAQGQKKVYGGSRFEPVNVTCQVDAFPRPSKFKWVFNTSSDLVNISESRIKNEPGRSTVAYTPRIPLDYGSLLCLSQNDVGWQREPCVFSVVPADVPEPVANCTARENIPETGIISIVCDPGWDGGLKQRFRLQVRRPEGTRVISQQDGLQTPNFTLPHLLPGTEYHITVIAINSEGSSMPYSFNYFNPIDIAEKRLSASAASGSPAAYVGWIKSTTVAVVAGVACAFFLVSILCFVLIRKRLPSQTLLRMSRVKVVYERKSKEADGKDDGGFVDVEESPDVIQVKSDNHTVCNKEGTSSLSNTEKSSSESPRHSIDKLEKEETDSLLPSGRKGSLLSRKAKLDGSAKERCLWSASQKEIPKVGFASIVSTHLLDPSSPESHV